jgi:hypothetical protein
MDPGVIRASLPREPISGGAAADRIADALGTPNPTAYGEKANVTAFVVRRFVDRGLLVDLSANPDGTLHHPGQVAEVCAREDLADLVAADTPLGGEQAAARLGVSGVPAGSSDEVITSSSHLSRSSACCRHSLVGVGSPEYSQILRVILVICRSMADSGSRRLSLITTPAPAANAAEPAEESLTDVLTLQRQTAAFSDSGDEVAFFLDTVAEYTWARDVAGLAATTLRQLVQPVIEVCDFYDTVPWRLTPRNTGDQPIAITSWGIELPGDRRMFVTRGENWATSLPHVLAPGAPPARFLVRVDELRRVEREQSIPYPQMRTYVGWPTGRSSTPTAVCRWPTDGSREGRSAGVGSPPLRLLLECVADLPQLQPELVHQVSAQCVGAAASFLFRRCRGQPGVCGLDVMGPAGVRRCALDAMKVTPG